MKSPSDRPRTRRGEPSSSLIWVYLLPLVAALLGGGLFVDEQWTASQWLPEVSIVLIALALCWRSAVFQRPDRMDWLAIDLYGWCVAVDVWQGTCGVGTLLWQTVLLVHYMQLRRSPLEWHSLALLITSLTAGCALHRLGYGYGLWSTPLFRNPAGYGGALVCGLPFAVAMAAKARSHWQKVLAAGGGVVILWALWQIGSRTAWFALLLAALGTGLYTVWPRLTRARRFALAVAVIVGLSAGLVGLYRLRPASADGRLLVYRVTVSCIAEAPLAGYGSRAIHRDYMPHQAAVLRAHPDHPARLLADNVPYAFNEPLGFTMKYGFVGLLLLAAAIGLPLRQALLHGPRRNSGWPYMLVAMSLALAGMSLTSYPTAYSYLCLLGMSALAVAGQNPTAASGTGRRPLRLWAKAVCTLVGLMAVAAVGELAVAEYRWRKAAVLVRQGQTAQALDSYAIAGKALGDRPDFLYNHAAELNLAGRHADSQRMLELCTHWLNNYDTELVAADNALATGALAEAERHLLQAAVMIPARFMPHYGLLQVYGERGDTAALCTTALHILAMPVKVPSADVDAIREAARDSLARYSHSRRLPVPTDRQ